MNVKTIPLSMLLSMAAGLFAMVVVRHLAYTANTRKYARTADIFMEFLEVYDRMPPSSSSIVDAWGRPVVTMTNGCVLAFISHGASMSTTNDDVVLSVDLKNGMREVRYAYRSHHFSTAVFSEKERRCREIRH